MNTTKDNNCFQSSSLNETKQIESSKNLKYFSDNNEAHETSVVNYSNISGMFPSQLKANSEMSQLFKVPTLNNLPVKQPKLKNIKSPPRRVQAGRVRNDVKKSQQKLSLIPRPSFINSNKSLHCSRSTQLNARKELIKKMVFLAECTLKENQVKQSTPVKMLAGLTPKKTPRSGGYFVLPEFKKKVPKLEEIRSPIEDFIKKEMFSYSTKLLNEKMPSKPCENIACDSENKKEIIVDLQSLPETRTRLNEVLYHCKSYSTEVTFVHEQIRNLDKAFESRLNQIPEYKIYNEFCMYQLKKEDLYKNLKAIEEEFRNSIITKMNVSNKLKTFVKRREELLQNQKSLLKDFEEVVQKALNKYNKIETKIENTEGKTNEETPKLRRSLRLSKISKSSEYTPMTKKLKKLDTKSRGIQKSGRL